MRVIQYGRGTGGAIETFGEWFRRNLDYDIAVKEGIVGLVCFADGSAAKRRQDDIRSEAVASGPGHDENLLAEVRLVEGNGGLALDGVHALLRHFWRDL